MISIVQRVLIVIAVCGAVIASPTISWTAAAQEVIDTNGTTDFRNPPTLENGVYRDTIVTGEAVWYAVVYTNDVPYRFEATLPAVDPVTAEELTIEVSFIGPTLGSVQEGPLLQGSASTNAGETNVWYLQVTLSTTGQLGVAHEMQLSIDGVQSSEFETCDDIPDCDLDEQLAELDEQLAALEDDLAGVSEPVDDIPEPVVDESVDAVDDETATQIAELEAEETGVRAEIAAAETRSTQAVTELTDAEAEIADICGDEPDCESVLSPDESSTPIWAWASGALVLLAGVAALAFSVVRRNARPTSPPV